ncbi:hypothetical protein OKJ48_19925 [Streptomyces kunmingensis]|uniref:Uncharacterized protein n=1 Tax=Streptomyces kunmingensis TaxID=68225 RepID=A0ABU6CCQ1_9ACTN|nr:hypothetical protein [Streptomyces kunmingensis]MEB3962504.1 hypothetical protein [Streptomyces kunmingensis]
MDGETWLASCHPDPEEAQRQWERPPHLARLPTGRRFDALRLSQPLGLTVLWELGGQAEKVPVLEQHIEIRPVFYILTEPREAGSWPRQPDSATVLTAGAELTVPSPHADALTGVQRHSLLWRTAPDGSGHLADPDVLRTALALARDTDRQKARIRAARSAFYGAKHRRQ